MERNNATGQDGICPHCHVKVDWLVFAEDRTVTGEYRNGVHYEVDSWPTSEDTITYECPKCGQVLFRDEREASAFLARRLQRPRGASTRSATKKVPTIAQDQKLVAGRSCAANAADMSGTIEAESDRTGCFPSTFAARAAGFR